MGIESLQIPYRTVRCTCVQLTRLVSLAMATLTLALITMVSKATAVHIASVSRSTKLWILLVWNEIALDGLKAAWWLKAGIRI